MGIGGSSLAGAELAARSAARLANWGDRFVTDAARLAPETESFRGLVPLDDHTIAAAFSAMRQRFVWVDDNNCLSRALMGAMRINQHAARTGLTAAPDDAFAGVAIARNAYLYGPNRLNYHAAAVVQAKGHSDGLVFDLLDFDTPVSMRTWAKRLQLEPNDVVVTSPRMSIDRLLADGLLTNEPTPPFALHADRLASTWRQHGRAAN